MLEPILAPRCLQCFNSWINILTLVAAFEDKLQVPETSDDIL